MPPTPLLWPGRTDPLVALAVKILKLALYLFLETRPQIWF
jgi:hypothetical protein